jgi:hypothetical protein
MHAGWQHALDVQMDQQKWHVSDDGDRWTRYFFESYFDKFRDLYEEYPLWAEAEAWRTNQNLKECLYRGDTIFVTKDMQHLLLQAAHDLPSDIRFDIRTLITPMGFVLLEETMYGQDAHDKKLGVNAMAWHVVRLATVDDHDPDISRDGLIIYFFTPTDDVEDEINPGAIAMMHKYNIPVPPLSLCHYYPTADGVQLPKDDIPGSELIVGLLKLFVAMQLLAQQKIGEPQRMSPPRAARKRAIKWDMHNQRYITLITLRRKSVKREGDPHPIDWSHRWVVQGHWRRQPDKHGWHWVYIYEHVKGPEDKPLIIRERRVFNFRR